MGRHEIFDTATSIPALNSVIGLSTAQVGIARILSAPPHGDQPPTDLVEACDWALRHSAWINGDGRDDKWDNARFDHECDKADAVWKRAVEIQAHDAATLAAKSRLLLVDLEDYFSSFPEAEPDARDRMTMSILRDAVAMGQPSASWSASQAAVTADPIFAALATYREAAAAMDALSDRIGGRRPSADEFAEENRLSAEQCRLRDAVLATVPTTPAGRAALVQLVRDEIDASGMADGGPPDDDHPIWRDGLRALLAAQEAELRAGAEAWHSGMGRAVRRQEASPDLVAMVERWQALLDRINGEGITDAEVEQLREPHDDLQRAIYNFPAASTADLLAKVPAFRDELYNATGSLDERDDVKDDLSGAAWLGLFRDFERLASTGGAVAASEGMEPESAVPRPAFGSDAHPDAALLALAATLPDLVTKADAASSARGDAEAAIFEIVGMPPAVKPLDIQCFPTDAAYHEAMRQWNQDCQERAYRRMRAELDTGFADLEDAHYETEDAVLDACERLAEMRATTPAGVIAKARFAKRGNWDQLSRSIVADLVAMGAAEDHLQIAPPLSNQIIACWREWAALPDFEETEQGKAEFNRLSAERSALCAAAEALPVELGNVPAKALALAWLGYVDLWQNGAARENYGLDGRLALDIDTAITGRLKTSYLEGAA